MSSEFQWFYTDHRGFWLLYPKTPVCLFICWIYHILHHLLSSVYLHTHLIIPSLALAQNCELVPHSASVASVCSSPSITWSLWVSHGFIGDVISLWASNLQVKLKCIYIYIPWVLPWVYLITCNSGRWWLVEALFKKIVIIVYWLLQVIIGNRTNPLYIPFKY